MVTHDACWRRSSNGDRSVFIVCRHASAAGARFRGRAAAWWRRAAPLRQEAGALPRSGSWASEEPLMTAGERQVVENARHPRADDAHAVCAPVGGAF